MPDRFSKLLKAGLAKFSISRESVLYTRYYKRLSVDSNVMLIDNCKSISDNMQLLKELCNNPDYKALKKYIVSDDCKAADKSVIPVKRNSKKHIRLLNSAGVIFSDCLDDFYIRRDGQLYVCTAKGDSFSRVQRNCIISSVILCQNESELAALRKKYMLDNIYTGKYALGSIYDSSSECINADTYYNNKENVVIFTGSLEKNGITTALKNLVSLAPDSRNVISFFYDKAVEPNRESVKALEVRDFISVSGGMDMTLCETLRLALYYFGVVKDCTVLDDIFVRELRRTFGDMRIDHIAHFTGYARNVLQLISRCDAKKYIWVHNNLFLEGKTKGNVDINTIKYAYDKCDKIVVVRETMKEELTSFVEPAQKDKITVVHNVNDAEGVRAKALEEIEFQRDTYCNVTIEELNRVLDSDVNKLINIARFSKEKGIDTLITAFDKYRKELDEKAYLIIIGGYGEEFESIKAMVEERENIILIKSIMNPYPILNKCDLFVLSSHYEGLPMTIIEALMLDKRVLSTDITGPKEFLEQGYGYLVEDSENGLYEGMKMFKENTIPPLTPFDVDAFNKNAIDEFNALFE